MYVDEKNDQSPLKCTLKNPTKPTQNNIIIGIIILLFLGIRASFKEMFDLGTKTFFIFFGP